MKFDKKVLAELPCCYAVSEITVENRPHYLFATDDTGPCYCFDAQTFERKTVWDGPGGTMSLVPLPGVDGELLASRKFLPGFTALEAEIVRARYADGRWTVEPWMELPYVHRFDILRRGGRHYFIGCVLSSTSEPSADFNSPGYIAVSELNGSFSPPDGLEKIAEGMGRNHGYWRAERDGYDYALVGCDEGIFEVVPPAADGAGWTVTKMLDIPASDIALCDIDGDGASELAVISPFHGNEFTVYRRSGDTWTEMYRHPKEMAFLHAIWGGMLAGKPVFIGGCREIGQELFMLTYNNGVIEAETIESGYGPSNVAVVRTSQNDILLVANREGAQAALFHVAP